MKPAIQVDLSAHVIMKLSSFMILPHLLFFVILPRLFGPVYSLQILNVSLCNWTLQCNRDLLLLSLN